jgi:hypothetical protein
MTPPVLASNAADWIGSAANIAMAVAAICALRLTRAELASRRREKRDDARDTAARDIISKITALRARYSQLVVDLELAITAHINPAFPFVEGVPMVLPMATFARGFDDDSAALRNSLYLGRSMWSTSFEKQEARIFAAHHAVLKLISAIESELRRPPVSDDDPIGAWRKRQMRHVDISSEFIGALDELAAAVGEHLYGRA